MRRILKITAIALIALLSVWLGERFGPQRVEAEVYKVLHKRSFTLPPLLQRAGLRQTRAGNLTNRHATYRVARWEGNVESLIERLNSMSLSGEPNGNFSNLVFEGGNWGYFALLPTTETGQPEGFILFAMKDDRNTDTQVWIKTLPGPSDVVQLLFDGNTTPSPGGEIRYPNALPLYTFKQNLDGSDVHVTGYQAEGGTAEHVSFFKQAFRTQGMELTSEYESENQTVLEFSDDDTEVSVYISPAGSDPGRTIDVVHYRAYRDGGT